MVIGNEDMQPVSVYVLSAVILLAVFCSYSEGHNVPAESSIQSYKAIEDLTREKRQVESFDDEYPTAANQDSQEETGFWDRVVKVALKLFSRFVEWLNS